MATKLSYTPEQTEQLKSLWNSGKGQTVEQLAHTFGKSAASIIQKLVRMQLYTAKPKVSKTGEKIIKKSEQAELIGKMLHLSVNDTDSLSKATKTALKAVSYAIAYSVPLEILTPIQETTRNRYADILGAFFGFNENISSSLRVLSLDTLQQAVTSLYEKNLIPDFMLKTSEDEENDDEENDEENDDEENDDEENDDEENEKTV